MQDFSKAEVSRNHNTSFKASIKTALEFIDELNQTYQTSRDELEVLRKERAAIIENIIQTLKNKKVKIDKPLGKCNNFEINEELLKVIEQLDFKEREKFQCDLIRINNRYARITELGKKLEDVSSKLATLHVPEGDYDDELVIDLNPSKEEPVVEVVQEPVIEVPVFEEEPIPTVETVSTETENIPVIEDITTSIPVIDDITMSIPVVDDVVEDVVLEPVQETKEPVKEAKPKKPVIIEESDLVIEESGKDNSLTLDLEYTPESKVTKSYTPVTEDEDDDDFLYYTITNGVTLEEIAQSVYEDSKLWIDLYKYDTNKGIIDRTAAKLKLTVKETCTKSGCLDNVKLKFPVELITYEEITN